MTRLALLAVLDASCALNLVEMKPLAAAMLAKRWATDQAELDQKVGIRDDGVTGVLRFGDDLKRRTEVAKALDLWQKTSLALAAAAKGGAQPHKKMPKVDPGDAELRAMLEEGHFMAQEAGAAQPARKGMTRRTLSLSEKPFVAMMLSILQSKKQKQKAGNIHGKPKAKPKPKSELRTDESSESSEASEDDDVTASLMKFDASKAQCHKKSDRERLLAVIESGFGDFRPFNKLVRGIFSTRARVADTVAQSV